MNVALVLSSSAVLLLGGLPENAPAQPFEDVFDRLRSPVQLAQARRTCQDMRSCREAVILWCEGYARADGDSDGIPCENVCSTRAEVEDIQTEIGC